MNKTNKREGFLPFEHPARGVVDAFVAQVPAPVFEDVLDGRHTENEDDRHHGDLLAEGVDSRDPVEQNDEEEVEVGESVKLLEQVLRQEREDGVLRGADEVVGVSTVRMLVGRHVGGYRVVRDHDSIPDTLFLFLVIIGGLLVPVPEEQLGPVGSRDRCHRPERVDRLGPRGLSRVTPERKPE